MFRKLINSPRALRFLLNAYPPFIGARIRTTFISRDFRKIRVEMPLAFTNRNYVGTHFGGSLFAMTDPFLMLMFIKNLGANYVVWDQASSIEFKSPGKGKVRVEFTITQADVDLAKEKTKSGEAYKPVFECQVLDAQDQIIAEISKTIYIRRKKT